MVLDTITAIRERRSIRRYRPDAIPEEDLRAILEAARLAPSGGNRQPWHFIVVAEENLKAEVAQASSNQMWMTEAAVIVATVGFPQVSPRWYMVDPAIAMENLILAATSLGYGTCWVGAFREDRVRELLGIPPEAKVVALTPVGLPAERPPARRRKGIREVASLNRYGQPLG